ncbi:MAG: hypothetical protein HC836_03960 [Richelia sp. RM2_1_2]|nr:hypothetical protein [Richelia sp. SM1_7_0]NJN07194.1 hypothetical protein [Richelia sp. RM1_1_1]NJO28214.1 hypothetical protein [Richelia sp. SL_2_1]NJO57561.1 hypothetical protein [Richelia sp. RM2_1_2]NJS17012.1 hypothetical protein [Nostocaceae cyanobacterium CSU_2_110]
MITNFISAKIDLSENVIELHKFVEAELHKHGKPLRWAITAVDLKKGKVTLEAVVTKQN